MSLLAPCSFLLFTSVMNGLAHKFAHFVTVLFEHRAQVFD